MEQHRLIPDFVWRRLSGRTVVQRVLGNSGWMAADQLWRMALSLFVGAWVARYLGPEQYGRLSYAIALVSLVTPLASVGLTGLLVRDFVRDRAAASEMIGTAVIVKLVAGAGVMAACGLAAWLLDRGADESFWLVLAVASGSIFQALDTVDSWLQAEDRYRDSALAKTAAATFTNLTKIGLILGCAPLLAFAVVGVLETALCGVGWLVAWQRRTGAAKKWCWSTSRARAWLIEAWPIVVMGLAIPVQTQADQVVIGRTLSAMELGQYAAAMRLLAVLACVPMVVQAAAAPEVARAKVEGDSIYRARLHRLYRFVVILTFGIATGLAFFHGPVVRLLLGDQFDGASTLLPVLAFRLVLVGLGVVRGLYLTNEGLFRYGMITAILGAGLSLALNLWLIPRWGLWGAVVVSFFSLTVTTLVGDLLMPATRPNGQIMLRALVMPWRGFSV